MGAKKLNPQKIIRDYLLDHIDIRDMDDDFDIFASGIVNSLFAIELMTFLEKSFNIKVTMDDRDMENFKSVNAASSFIKRKEEVEIHAFSTDEGQGIPLGTALGGGI